MGLIAEDPWQNIGPVYRDLTAIDLDDNQKAGDFEANYYAQKVPDASGVQGDLYGLALDVDQNPVKDGYWDNPDYINTWTEINQEWENSGFSINELSSSPVGDKTTDYNLSASFTVSASPAGTLGVNVESPEIERQDKSQNDATTHHAFDYPGYYICDKAKCSRVVLGNVSKADVDKPPGDSFSYCPTWASGSFLHASTGEWDIAGASPYFDPELQSL